MQFRVCISGQTHHLIGYSQESVRTGCMIDTLLPFLGKQGESITPSEHSLPQAGTDQSGILSDERAAPPALFNQFTAGRKPRRWRG